MPIDNYVLQSITDLGLDYCQCVYDETGDNYLEMYPGIREGASLFTYVYDDNEDALDDEDTTLIVDNPANRSLPTPYWPWQGIALELERFKIHGWQTGGNDVRAYVAVYLFDEDDYRNTGMEFDDSSPPPYGNHELAQGGGGICSSQYVVEALKGTSGVFQGPVGNNLRYALGGSQYDRLWTCCDNIGRLAGNMQHCSYNEYPGNDGDLQGDMDLSSLLYFQNLNDYDHDDDFYFFQDSGTNGINYNGTNFANYSGLQQISSLAYDDGHDYQNDGPIAAYNFTNMPNLLQYIRWDDAATNMEYRLFVPTGEEPGSPEGPTLDRSGIGTWTDNIVNTDSNFILLFRLAGDKAGNDRDRGYYPVRIPKKCFKLLYDNYDEYNKIVINIGDVAPHEWADHSTYNMGMGYYKVDSPSFGMPVGSYVGITSSDCPTSIQPLGEYTDNFGGGTDTPMLRFDGARIILSGPGAFATGTIGEDTTSTVNEAFDPIVIPDLTDPNISDNYKNTWVNYEDQSDYWRFNPLNHMDLTNDDTALNYPNFRPISDFFFDLTSDSGDEISLQQYYENDPTTESLTSAPMMAHLSFDISTNMVSIENQINLPEENIGYMFAVVDWGDLLPGQSELDVQTKLGNILTDLEDMSLTNWQMKKTQGLYDWIDITDETGNRNRQSHAYFTGGNKEIFALVFSYTYNKHDSYSNYVQARRWKLVRILANINEASFEVQDFQDFGTADFLTIPWNKGKTPIIGGTSSNSKYTTTLAATVRGGEFETAIDRKDKLRLKSARNNDELGKHLGKADLEQSRVFIGPRDMHELLMIEPIQNNEWHPYWDTEYWTGEIMYDDTNTEILTGIYPLDGESCVGTSYISDNQNFDLRNDCIIELNMGELQDNTIHDTSGAGNRGFVIGDYSISKKAKTLRTTRTSAISRPEKSSDEPAI